MLQTQGKQCYFFSERVFLSGGKLVSRTSIFDPSKCQLENWALGQLPFSELLCVVVRTALRKFNHTSLLICNPSSAVQATSNNDVTNRMSPQ
jgi:hypothetical protein